MQSRSVVRAVEILTLISRSKEGLSLNEIVEATGIPKTTAYEILLMLLETEMIADGEGKVRTYKIGLKSFLIGSRYVQNMDLVQVARPFAEKAMKQLNMTVFIAMLDGNQIVYIHKSEPEHVPIYTANVSNRDELYCTSLGKAILSALPEEKMMNLIGAQSFRKRTERTITDSRTLLRDLAETRKRGYAVDNREILDFVMCVGAPLFNHDGKAGAAISVAGLFSPDRDTGAEGKLLADAARSISKQLGYTGGYYG